MQLIDGSPVYSASDLVGFLACEHLTQLERAVLAGLAERPHLPDPELDVLRKRGMEHERRYLSELAADGRSVVVITPDAYSSDHAEALRMAAAATEAAMASGARVIYQATFFNGRWRGHADFLLRTESPGRPSTYGPYHYEVADTKLARHVKASAVLQICSYVDQLTALQGIQPEWLHVALGGSARETARLRVDDFMAYYRASKRRFEEAVGPDAVTPAYPPAGTYPDPVEHCAVCRWTVECQIRRRADDHLSLVAGIGRQQRRGLVDRGVTTLAQLGTLHLPLVPPLDGSTERTVERVREQARIQLEGRLEGTVKYELLLPEGGQTVDPERGLASLPLPSPGDLFFDIEGDPYAFEDGLEYLFGVMDVPGAWHAIWSTDAAGGFTFAGEKAAFETLMDLFTTQLERFPDAHIYHFHSYEPSALKHLMGKHATRENEVDRLLRGGVMIDLHRIVRQALHASVESYGLKKLEPLYGYQREVDLRDAGSSIVAFEQWLELGEGERPAADHLVRIERYNRDDVISTRQLRDWLESRRTELAELLGAADVGRPAPRDPAPPDEQAADLDRVAQLKARLTADTPPDPADRSSAQQATWLLAQLLSWHRREEKATWWQFFRLMALNASQLIEETDPIGGLEPIEPVTERDAKGRQAWRYRFPAQEYRVSVHDAVFDPGKAQLNPNAKPGEWQIGSVRAIDHAARTVDIQRLANDAHPAALVALDVFQTGQLRARLFEIGEWVAEHGIDDDGRYRAARDLLLRRPPRLRGGAGGELRGSDEAQVDAARRLALDLDRGTLPIQGPPGSGKTYTGARMILALLQAGKRVGVTAQSHKVIGNIIGAVLSAAEEAGVSVRPLQKAEKDQKLADDRVGLAKDAAHAASSLATGVANLVAGTVWLWASPRMGDTVDVLFVDEAGQMSLANVIAASPAAASVVLLGDPQQLDQVLQGSHPPGAERSALAHLLDRAATIRPTHGLFLATTWRLHPDLCRYTSETFYDSRLEPEPHLAQQVIDAAGPAGGTGPRWIPVAHRGNDNESAEEALVIAELATSLVQAGATWLGPKGTQQPVGWEEIVIVAPYNAQVGAIQRLLPSARVGTVDKFQGQEAPISIYSMAASSGEEAPRGMDFLYSRNRLNVATSRARCVAILVTSPDLPRVGARTVEQMRLANALCRFVEVAAGQAAGLTAQASSGDAEREWTEVLWPGL